MALLTRYELTAEAADLDRAIDIGRRATRCTQPTEAGRAAALSNLGLSARTRYEQHSDPDDLALAVESSAAAVAIIPAGHPAGSDYRPGLGAALLLRYESAGRPEDLDAALTNLRAVDDPSGLTNLGLALRKQFEVAGSEAALAAAVGALRASLTRTPTGHIDRPERLANLAGALLDRYEVAGQETDLEEAIGYLAESLAAESKATLRPSHQENLGVALLHRHAEFGEPTDLTRALVALRDAVRGWPIGSVPPGTLSNLGAALVDVHQETGDEAALHEAIDVLGTAARATPVDHPDLSRYRSNLNAALRLRYAAHQDPRDLERAIRLARAAVEHTEPTHPDRCVRLFYLGLSLQYTPDQNAAVARFREALAVPSAPPALRLAVAVILAESLVDTGGLADAVDPYAAAVALAPVVAWHGLDRRTREKRLAHLSEITADAAASQLAAGQPGRATELVESGRSVLWGQLLGLRSQSTRLATQRPELAARFTEMRRRMSMDGRRLLVEP
jgi:tetratricopeptide (TPR) repeat protein